MSEQLSRRGFVKAVSGTLAVAGAVSAGGSSQASASEPATPARWSGFWRPETPRRLSDTTHGLARRALAGEHGRSMKPAAFEMDASGKGRLAPDLEYARAAMLVARHAPLRILPGERIVGSATLLEAASHQVPLLRYSSVSHTTLGFHRVLKTGYAGLRRQVADRLARGGFETREVEPSGRTGPGQLGPAFIGSPGGRHWAEADLRPEYATWPLTVECRARLDSANHFNILAAHRGKDSVRHWEIFSEAGSGRFSAYLPGFAPDTLVSNCVITDGQWHHLAMTVEADRVRLYVDGETKVDARVTPKEGMGQGGGALWVGAYGAGQLGCDGAIEQVRLSRGVRTFGAIAPEPMRPDATTIALWGFDSDTGEYPDSSPLGNPLIGLPTRSATPGKDLLEAMLTCLDAADVWHRRHVDALEALAARSGGDERAGYEQVLETVREVPARPPRTFHEAVQSLWFMYAFQRLMGNWSGIGRIDEMLGPYLDRDVKTGRLSLDEAREILAHFWIKGCEWVGVPNAGGGSGDAQFYQNIILGGVDADGREVANDVTYLVLDIVEELRISDFPIAVRINRNTPERLLRRIAEVQRHGGGIVAVYNEEVVIEGLVQFGYSLEEARTYTNDGCWEVLIPGRTTFSYVPFDMLALLQRTIGLHGETTPVFESFEALYQAFLDAVRGHIDAHGSWAAGWALDGVPSPLVSLFVEDCIERARGYYDRGSKYTVLAPHAGGMANVANSLLVIRKLVYDDKYMSLSEFVRVLRDDWQGHEHLRRLVLDRFTFYGNDDATADAMMRRVFDDYASIVERTRECNGVLLPAGISTFGREIGWAGPDGRKATADGHHVGEYLATNCSPSPGTDLAGPTAVLKSYCALDFARTPNGATVELKLHPLCVRGDKGVDAMVGLLRGFVRLGGWFMHVDVADSAMLVDAQRHPEKYPNLAVRIAGWSARFATLDRQWQDMVIGRTQQML